MLYIPVEPQRPPSKASTSSAHGSPPFLWWWNGMVQIQKMTAAAVKASQERMSAAYLQAHSEDPHNAVAPAAKRTIAVIQTSTRRLKLIPYSFFICELEHKERGEYNNSEPQSEIWTVSEQCLLSAQGWLSSRLWLANPTLCLPPPWWVYFFP